jgi:DNA-binding protein Fis
MQGVLLQKTKSGASLNGGSDMGAERVGGIGAREPPAEASVERTAEPEIHRNQRADESFTPPSQLKFAGRPVRGRVQRLLDLADTLLKETSSLARDKAFTEESNRLQSLNVSEGVDFYNEVKRFESGLIRLALDQTGGHQARAAKLLHIKPTTLNSKIKLYGIQY